MGEDEKGRTEEIQIHSVTKTYVHNVKSQRVNFFIFIYFFDFIDNMLQGSPNLYWDFRSLKNISYQLT